MLGGTSVTHGGSSTRVLKIEMFDSKRNERTGVSQIPVERFESEEELINKGKKFKANVLQVSSLPPGRGGGGGRGVLTAFLGGVRF